MASLFPSIPAATTLTDLVLLQTIAYIQALRIHSLSYMMPSKPLAANASVFNGNFVDDIASTVETSQNTDFTTIYSKCWASCDLSRFSPRFYRFFSRKHLIHVLANKMQDFRNFVLHRCIVNFDADQVYLKLRVTNVINKDSLGLQQTLNPKP